MHTSKALGVFALAALALSVAWAFAILSTEETLRSVGTIRSVGVNVYWNQQCTNETDILNFGEMEPDSSKDFTLYLRNEGNIPLTLNMTSENWNPSSATSYMLLTWNREGEQVSPDEVLEFVVALSVFQNVTGINTFSLDIVITGTG